MNPRREKLQSNLTLCTTAAAVVQQVSSMGSQLFEVGLYDPGAAAGQSVMIARVWDAGTIVKSVPWLRHQNREGPEYLRPTKG